jgi:hypothetical protein
VLCGPVAATSIVAYRTDAHLAIAADSLATDQVRMGSSQSRVCKIFEQHGAIFAMAGTISWTFDPAQVIREELRSRKSIRDAAAALSARLPRFYDSWLANLRPHDLDQLRQGAKGTKLLTSLVLGAYESAGPAAAALDVYLTSGPSLKPDARIGWLCDASECRRPFTFLGYYQVIVSRMKEFLPGLPPEASNPTAAENAASLLQLEIDAKTPAVGPPIAVAQAGADGVSWPSVGACIAPYRR